MIINKNKRIGEIIIIVEGEHPEFEIIKQLFNVFMNFSVISSTRKDENFEKLIGERKDSIVYLINSPGNNIKSISRVEDFYDYIYKKVCIPYNLDTTNFPVYIIFDRDARNNRHDIVKNLLDSFSHSQGDENSEEQNGLLLLSYPSLESFVVSLNENMSYQNKFGLGKQLKDYIDISGYDITLCDENIKLATHEFLGFLREQQLINSELDLFDEKKNIGREIFDVQQAEYTKTRSFYCFSQFVQILIDLGIIEFDDNIEQQK